MNPTEHHLKHPKYRPDIDGLRAIAVLSVVGYHAFPGRVPGGFVGVDIFFVISGFLISTIIFGNLERDNFSYLEFYARRIKRIFPALLAVLIFTMLFGWYVLVSDEFRQLGKHVAGGAGFISNIILWNEAGYFDAKSEFKPLLHLWSLGIEEQFYIFWPLLLGLVWYRKLNFLLITISIAVVSFVINLYSASHNSIAGFYSPFSRIWELMVGGGLGYVMLHRPHYLSTHPGILSLFSILGVTLIGISVVYIRQYMLFPGWLALLPTFGAFLVIAGNRESLVNRLLSNRVAVWIGLISYPLYLWHWPLISYAHILSGGTPQRSTKILAVISSLLLAWGTYALIEKRFKRAYSRFDILIQAVLMGLVLIIGLTMWSSVVLPRQDSESVSILIEATADWDYPGQLRPIRINGEKFYEKRGANGKTLFFGDSHIEQFAPRVTHQLEENLQLQTAVFATKGGCPPIPKVYGKGFHSCPGFREAAMEFSQREDVKAVVIGGAWNAYFLDQGRYPIVDNPENLFYYFQDGNQRKHNFKGGDGVQLALNELESFLREIAKRKKVYLLLDNPGGKEYSPHTFIEGSRLSNVGVTAKLRPNEFIPMNANQLELRQELIEIATRAGVSIIDPVPHLCSNGLCRFATEAGKPIYKDWHHLRPFFVERNADFIDVTLGGSEH